MKQDLKKDAILGHWEEVIRKVSQIFMDENSDSIGNVAKITKSRREIQISSENRTANLTLWGTIAEDSCIEAESTYNIIAIKAANEFRGQLAFNSTPSTIFEIPEVTIKLLNTLEESIRYKNGTKQPLITSCKI
eukprot:XP_019927779.1 PREDICTED: uncharacterized protein LOC109620238 [Crassostrea gigas]